MIMTFSHSLMGHIQQHQAVSLLDGEIRPVMFHGSRFLRGLTGWSAKYAPSKDAFEGGWDGYDADYCSSQAHSVTGYGFDYLISKWPS
jgi:hypothetical protein